MTLPTNVDLPIHDVGESQENLDRYLKDLIYQLQETYSLIADNVNGSIRSYADTQLLWTPTINGSTTTSGVVYTKQVGWSIRQGIFTHIFFDVAWSSIGTSSGNMYLALPYKTIVTEGEPFVSAVALSGITITPYTALFISAIPNSYQGNILKTGQALTSDNLKITDATSGSIQGNLFYIGVEDE
jgi:hypothetical protein